MSKIEQELSEDQYEFRKGRGTREAIRGLRLVIEKKRGERNRNKSTTLHFLHRSRKGVRSIDVTGN